MASLYAQRELTLRQWLTSLLGHPGGESVNHPNVATWACFLFTSDPRPPNRPRPNANDHHFWHPKGHLERERLDPT